MNDPKELAAIQREADWVLTRDTKAAPAARAKAQYVTGLALRNEGNFDAARQALAGAVKHAGAKDAAWQKQAQAALAELTDARAYYLPQIERLHAAGNVGAALAETDRALKALPANGRLLAERAALRLEAQRAKGKLSGEAQKQIRDDAAAAAKNPGTAAEGAYVLGLLEEELGQYAKAEAHFRDAIKAYKGSDDAATVRYRIALARVLLQDRPAAAAPAPAPAAPADDKKGAAATAAPRPISAIHPVTALILTAAIGAQPEPDAMEPEQENPAAAKRLREAVDLAKTLANSKDAKVREQGYALLAEAAGKAGQQLTSTTCIALAKGLVSQPDPKVRGTGLMLMGQGLVKQGKRTEGLKQYVQGLELVHPDLATREIARMVEEHPAFQHPDAKGTPNPLLAERAFGNGLHLFWARNYPAAEAQFKQAMNYFGQDAALCVLPRPGAARAKLEAQARPGVLLFRAGAHLEAQGRPSIADINTSLERIQGHAAHAAQLLPRPRRRAGNGVRRSGFTFTPARRGERENAPPHGERALNVNTYGSSLNGNGSNTSRKSGSSARSPNSSSQCRTSSRDSGVRSGSSARHGAPCRGYRRIAAVARNSTPVPACAGRLAGCDGRWTPRRATRAAGTRR